MARVLVVHYSYTGTCRTVAQALAERKGWQSTEVLDAVPGRSYLRSLLDSLLRRTPRIRYDGPHPGDFDLVVLVFPVWAWPVAGPMRSFVTRWQPELRRVALVPVMGGHDATGAVAEMTGLLKRPAVAREDVTASSVQDGSFRPRLALFGARLDRQAGPTATVRPQNQVPHAA
jgi:hypothetical protein